MTRKARKTDKARAPKLFHGEGATPPLAIRPTAMGIYWDWGIGTPNAIHKLTTVVTIEGPLEQRSSWWDGYDAILERFREACDDRETSSVVLRLDSPGGECAGLFECVRLMREAAAASGKRIVAYADETAYSAAYALACVADEIYLPPSGGVGSVGVIARCADRVGMNEQDGITVAVVYSGARKADCHPDLPLSEDAIAGVQADVDTLAVAFRELVAEARGVDVEEIEALEAGTFLGAEALSASLADGTMGFDDVIAMLATDGVKATDEGDESSDDEKEATAMGKKNARIKASEVTETDLLAKPQVGVANLTAKDVKSEDKAEDESEEKDGESAEDEESEDKAESEEKDEDEDEAEEEEEEEEEEKDDEEEDEEKPKDKAKSAAARAPRTNATSHDVLKLVRDMTGESNPAAIMGALEGLKDRAASADKARKAADKAKAEVGKTKLASVVDKAVRMGKLAPAQREWAMGIGLEGVRGYLKTAAPVVKRSPTAQKKTTKEAASSGNAGDAKIDDATRAVAKAMQLDATAVANHGAELRKAGVIH